MSVLPCLLIAVFTLANEAASRAYLVDEAHSGVEMSSVPNSYRLAPCEAANVACDAASLMFPAWTGTPQHANAGVFVPTQSDASLLSPALPRQWVAMVTEVHGLVFRVPRLYLHLRFPDGGFEFGLRTRDFGPISLLGLNDRIFWQEALRVKVIAHSGLNGTAEVQRSLGFYQLVNAVQTTSSAPLIVDPYGAWHGRPPPEGLRYFPRPEPRADLPENVRQMGRERDLFIPERPARSPVTGEELPEFIMCNLNRPDRSGTPSYPCTWNFVYRNLPVSIFLAREHLLRWQEIRRHVVERLDSFVTGSLTEALTPPPGWRRSSVNPVLIYDPN